MNRKSLIGNSSRIVFEKDKKEAAIDSAVNTESYRHRKKSGELLASLQTNDFNEESLLQYLSRELRCGFCVTDVRYVDIEDEVFERLSSVRRFAVKCAVKHQA